jgi:hypothetical protein
VNEEEEDEEEEEDKDIQRRRAHLNRLSPPQTYGCEHNSRAVENVVESNCSGQWILQQSTSSLMLVASEEDVGTSILLVINIAFEVVTSSLSISPPAPSLESMPAFLLSSSMEAA